MFPHSCTPCIIFMYAMLCIGDFIKYTLGSCFTATAHLALAKMKPYIIVQSDRRLVTGAPVSYILVAYQLFYTPMKVPYTLQFTLQQTGYQQRGPLFHPISKSVFLKYVRPKGSYKDFFHRSMASIQPHTKHLSETLLGSLVVTLNDVQGGWGYPQLQPKLIPPCLNFPQQVCQLWEISLYQQACEKTILVVSLLTWPHLL